MKRICALFLVIAIFLSLTGCEVNIDKEELKEHIEDEMSNAVDHVKDEISNAVNDAVDQAKDEAANKADELMENAKEQANKIADSVMEMPKHLWQILFQGGSSSDEEGTTKVCPCDSFYYESVCSTNWFTWTDDTYVIRCKECNAPCSVEKLTFSVYLKCIYKGKDPAELSQKKKDKALNTYIRSKAWMAADEMSDANILREKFQDPDNLGAFEFFAVFAESPSKLKDTIPGLNSEAFFLFQNYLPAAFSDAGIESPFLDIVGDVGSVCDFMQLCGAAETTAKEWERYKKEKDRGIENTYDIREAYVKSSISNAYLMDAFTSFLGIYDISGGVPSPDIDSIGKQIASLAKQNDLKKYYEYLSTEKSIINKYVTVNDVLNARGFAQFRQINSYSTEMIEAAMKQGPTSKEIAEAIPYIIEATNKSEKNLSETIASALWYYYGWRQEYEYGKFIEWIYADEPCSFQSYLKGE